MLKQLWRLVAAIGASAALHGAPVAAQEIILYDFEDFQGGSVRLTESARDLDDFDFDNDAESIRVISGVWEIYRNDDFGVTSSRPSMVLQPGDYRSLDDIGFPNDRLSSVRRLEGAAPEPPPPSPPAQGGGEIILYDFEGFGGRSVRLTENTPDLDAIGFDNDAEAVRVVSGIWELFRNAGYGVTPSRPSITLGPGDYPSLEDLGFPEDRLSAVRLAQAEPGDQDADCQGPYRVVNGDRCVWSCGSGTQPDFALNECVCREGFNETGVDQFGRRVCSIMSEIPVAGEDVCCLRGNARDLVDDPQDCLSVGGRVIAQNRCVPGGVDVENRVCCTRGDRDYLTTRRRCRRDGGRVVPDDQCLREN